MPNKLAVVLIPALAAGIAWSSSAAWQKEDAAQWSSEDINQILSNSPWAKAVRVTVSRTAGYGENDGQRSGGGGWGETGQMPGGMGRMGGGGMGGGGMGGSGRGRNGRGVPSSDEPSVTILWESALPVRLAEAKLNASTADVKPSNQYVISVIGLPKSGFRVTDSDRDSDDSELAGHLKVITVLTLNHEHLNPSKVELNQGRDARTVFYFDRSEPATERDKDAEFRITSDRMDLRKKFSLKDMEYQGKLQL